MNDKTKRIILITACCLLSSYPAVSIVSIIFFCFINSFRHGCLSADRDRKSVV